MAEAILEPLLTKTLAPSLYQVYLHVDDYDRLLPPRSDNFTELKIKIDIVDVAVRTLWLTKYEYNTYGI